MSTLRVFAPSPLVIAALHLPDFARSRERSMAYFEDYAATNARVFAQAGIPYLKLQDSTREAGPAALETVAMTAALGRFLKAEVPQIGLGIIVEAHDPKAAIAVAHAANADFVRLKVFVGGAMTAQGPRHGIGADGLIITGGDFADSLARIRKARGAGIKRPILLGGSVTEGNVAEALSVCDGVVVSTALMRKDAASDDLLRWDIDLARRFMDAARA